MLKLITKYGLAAHLAFLGVAPLFLSPSAVFWLSALGLIWVMMEPSRIGDEMLHDARQRLSRGVVRDPFFWLSIVLAVVSGVRAFNSISPDPVYDLETGWSLAVPSYPLLPGAAEGKGLSFCAACIAAVIVLVGTRHALGRKARFAFLTLTGFCSSIHLLSMLVTGELSKAAAAELFAAHPLNPFYNGVLYGIFLFMAIAGLVACIESKWWMCLPMAMVSIFGNATGLVLFSSPTIDILFGIGLILVIAYAFLYLRFKLGKTSDFRFFTLLVVSFAVSVMILISTVQSQRLSERIDELSFAAVRGQFESKPRAKLSEISQRMWKDSPWLGCGIGLFRQNLENAAKPADWRERDENGVKILQPDQSALENGYWYVLVERGVIGVFLMSLPIVLLLCTYIRKAVAAGMVLPHPAIVIAPIIVCIAIAETFVDCSFMVPAAIIPFLALISVSAGSFSKGNLNNG